MFSSDPVPPSNVQPETLTGAYNNSNTHTHGQSPNDITRRILVLKTMAIVQIIIFSDESDITQGHAS